MKPKKKLALLSDRLYVNHELVEQRHTEAFTETWEETRREEMTGEPRQCENCKHWKKKRTVKGRTVFCHLTTNPVTGDKYGELDSCGSFAHRVERQVVEVKMESFASKGDIIMFSRGDLDKIRRTFHDFEIIDDRSVKRLDFPLKFTSTLRDYQVEPVAEWLKRGFGILKGPTACGKSVMLAAIIAECGMDSLILSHESRHLVLLEERIREHTNLNQMEKEAGHKLLGIFSKGKGPWPITLSTFQAWTSKNGQKLLPSVKNNFGLVWVDECHHSAAVTFHHVLSEFNPWFRGGTTATPTRKDKMHHAIYNTLGPITSQAHREMLACQVTWVRTGINVPHSLFKYGKYGFNKMQTWLGKNPALLQLTLELVLKDIEDGRKVLVIHERRNAIFWLRDNLTHAGYNVEVIVGGTKQVSFDSISDKLVDGDIHCIIGSKVMNENIDIPPLDCLHLPAPSANEEMEEQRAGRIRRPWPSFEDNQKKTPIIRSYCYGGHHVAQIVERVRGTVYKRLGFISGTEPSQETVTPLKDRF